MIMNVGWKGMLKPGFWVSLSTGVHLSLKKVTEYRNIYQNACIGGTYVSDPQVGVHPAPCQS